jgi:hypothetical protein
MHFVLPSLLVDDKGGDGWIGNSNVDDKGGSWTWYNRLMPLKRDIILFSLVIYALVLQLA